MSRVWTKEKRERFLREGRGQGEYSNYKGWISIQDFPSKGRVSRIKGWKSKRIHQLFSDIQTRFFYLMEFEDMVVDIRENYPLLDLEETLDGESDIDFSKIADKVSGEPLVLTITFLLTINLKGQIKYIARNIKQSSQLDKGIAMNKYELIRRYCIKKNIDWGIVTEKEIPKDKCQNIEWVHSSIYGIEDIGLDIAEVLALEDLMIKYTLKRRGILRVAISNFDEEYNLDTGTGICLFKHSIATKKIIINMDKKIDLNNKIEETILGVNEVGEKRRDVIS